MITIVAQNGHKDPAEAQTALDAGKALLAEWAASANFDVKQEITVDTLDENMELLRGLNGKDRRKLLLAICATFDIPLPPILE